MNRSAALSTCSSALQCRNKSVLMFLVKSVGQSISRSAQVSLDRSVQLFRSRSARVVEVEGTDLPMEDMEEAILAVTMEVKVGEGVIVDQVPAGEDQETLMMDYCQESLALVQANPRGRSQDMARGHLTQGCIFLARIMIPAQGHPDQASGGDRAMQAAVMEEEDQDTLVEGALGDHQVDHPVVTPVEGEAMEDLPVEAMLVMDMEVRLEGPLEAVRLFPGNNVEQFRNNNVEMFLPRSAAM